MLFVLRLLTVVFPRRDGTAEAREELVDSDDVFCGKYCSRVLLLRVPVIVVIMLAVMLRLEKLTTGMLLQLLLLQKL